MFDADSKKFFFRFIAIIVGSLTIIISIELYQNFFSKTDLCQACNASVEQTDNSQN